MFWNNYSVINPAVSGLYYKHHANVSYRNQWDKVNGAPNTITAGYNIKLDALHGGLGANYQYETIGLIEQGKANLNYSYHIKLGETGILAVGIAAGFVHAKSSGNWIPPTSTPDPTLPVSGNKNAFFLNAGIVYKARKFSIGLSSTQINEPRVKGIYYYSLQRHYYLFADYIFPIGNDYYVKPQVIVRTDEVKMSADFNVLGYFKNQYWIGLSYRTSDAVAFMGGWDIKEKFRIGYSYDLTINKLSSISRGTHEIVLGFMLKDK